MERLLLDVADVAGVLGLSRSMTYRLLRSGQLPALRVGYSWKVPTDALREWIKQQTVGGQEAATK